MRLSLRSCFTSVVVVFQRYCIVRGCLDINDLVRGIFLSFFGDDVDAVPVHCLTQGLGTISAAGHLVLLATGRHKAEAVHQLVEGPVSALWPATIMQFHPHATVLVDEAAASRLQLAGYYRHAYAAKPDWQGL